MQHFLRIWFLVVSLFVSGAPAYSLISQDTVATTAPTGTTALRPVDAYKALHFHKPEQASPAFAFPVLEEEDIRDFHDHDAALTAFALWLGAMPNSPPAVAGSAVAEGIFPDVRLYPATCQRHVLLCVFRV